MLEPKIRSQLIEAHQELVDQGKLPSREQLGRYYDTFRERFGPERLTSLDGEALLEYMHLHGNYDSLVYWLEFKNDEEFPAIFGSIAGGSALKFGIYRSATTGAWMNGTPLHMNEISVDEAVNRARKHRNQFVHGATVLERFPRNGSDADYARLQAEMSTPISATINTASCRSIPGIVSSRCAACSKGEGKLAITSSICASTVAIRSSRKSRCVSNSASMKR